MNLRALDLNLLVVLDALISEQHVTRAADRIGLSQPAMSNALGRLRHIFNDDLLVRTASGMQPTPLASQLREPTQLVLRQIERVFQRDMTFDALLSDRSFVVRLSDLLAHLLLPALMEQIAKEAPNVSLNVLHTSPAQTIECLEKDEIDVAVSMGLEPPHSISSETLFQDAMVCVMRQDHPLATEPLTLSNFLAWKHLKVSMSPTDLRFVDDILSRQRLKRDVALNVPHWLILPQILARTDFIAVMPGSLAKAIGGSIASLALPFASEPFDWSIYWHRRHDKNPAIAWLRETIAQVSRRPRPGSS